MTNPAHDPAHDHAADDHPLRSLLPEPLLRVVGARYDRARLGSAPANVEGLARLIAAFANSAGGHALLGAAIEPETGHAGVVAGVDPERARAELADAIAQIDPPVGHLVTLEQFAAVESAAPLTLVGVRQSPAPPHLVVPLGGVFVSVATGVRAVASRAELDALYQRGRSERERADRQIDAMIEKLLQSHYAFYGVGFVACTQQPSAEPYLWAREHADELLSEDDPFCAGWKLGLELVKVRPGEIEVRGEREAHGYVRITRGGCVAVGEVRRRPAGNTVGSIGDVVRRIGTMVSLGCRVLAHAPNATIVPRLFYEGMRSQRVILSKQPYAESRGLELDTAQFPDNLGNPTDADYQRRLAHDILTRVLAGYGVEFDGELEPETESA